MNRTLWKPHVRTEGMSITVAGSETLVYDPESFMIHRLGPDVATVWHRADGTRDIATIATEQGLSVRAVESALTELAAMNLVDGETADQSKISRRLFVGGAAGVAAASTLIPVSAASPETCGGDPMPDDAPQVCGWFGLVPGCRSLFGIETWWCVRPGSNVLLATMNSAVSKDEHGEMPLSEAVELYNKPRNQESQPAGDESDPLTPFQEKSSTEDPPAGNGDEFISDPEPLIEEPESDPDFVPTSSEVEVAIPPEN